VIVFFIVIPLIYAPIIVESGYFASPASRFWL
jgi:hypothetical protein